MGYRDIRRIKRGIGSRFHSIAGRCCYVPKAAGRGKRIDQITDASQLAAIGYWAENSSTTTGNIKQYITSVADIEEKTGYKFFTMLDEAIAADVKAQNNPSDWGIN